MLEDPHALVVPDGTEVITSNQYEETEYERVFIPNTVVEIKFCAFNECKSLREVVFEEGNELKAIGEHAFNSCSSLVKINLPEGLKTIENSLFFGCTSLKCIRLPDGFERIGIECFRGSGLEELVLPASVKEIGAKAFEWCKQLKIV